MASEVLNIWVVAAIAWVVACFCNNAVWTRCLMVSWPGRIITVATMNFKKKHRMLISIYLDNLKIKCKISMFTILICPFSHFTVPEAAAELSLPPQIRPWLWPLLEKCFHRNSNRDAVGTPRHMHHCSAGLSFVPLTLTFTQLWTRAERGKDSWLANSPFDGGGQNILDLTGNYPPRTP